MQCLYVCNVCSWMRQCTHAILCLCVGSCKRTMIDVVPLPFVCNMYSWEKRMMGDSVHMHLYLCKFMRRYNDETL